MAKARKATQNRSHLLYTNSQHNEYLRMIDLVRLRWKHLFDGRPQFNTNMFRNFVLNIWKTDRVPLADACQMLPELKSPNTQREYIYKLYDQGILNSDVYVGTDKIRRDMEESYGRGKASPLVWLSDETRAKVDLYLDEALSQIVKTAHDVTI